MICFWAFLLSGVWSGVAGLLFLCYSQFISPQVAALATSAEALRMVVSGAPRRCSGRWSAPPWWSS